MSNINALLNNTFNNDILTLGIAGGSGAGKTTICNNLEKKFGNDICFLRSDNYYKNLERITGKHNFDHPDSIDIDLMVDHIQKLKRGEPIHSPVYHFPTHSRTSEVILVHNKRLVILEGILILAIKQIRDLLDIKVYVDADNDERYIRREDRDMKERGRSKRSVVEQWRETVKPMHIEHVEPSKTHADIIIPSVYGRNNQIAQTILSCFIYSWLNKNQLAT